MNFKPKLVAFDLDGTLAESKQRVSAEIGELLGRLLEIVPVAILSGAKFSQFENQLLPALPDAHLSRLFLFPTSAAQCYRYSNGKWQTQYDHSFSTAERARIMQSLSEALAEVGLTEEPAQRWGERIEDRGAQVSFSPLGQQAPVEAKREWNGKFEPLRKQLHTALVKRLPDFSVRMGGLTTIDITRKGVNKAYGIRKLIELTDVSISEMLYVGDALQEGGNDAVVIETGVKTHQVFGPAETAGLIEEILAGASHTTI